MTRCLARSALAAALVLAPTIAVAQSQATPEEPEIVVRAVRGKCKVQLADRMLSDREFDARTREWAALGAPVRVIAPDGASYKCLAKIAFRLNDKGVRLVQFVDRDEAARDVDSRDQASPPVDTSSPK